MVFAAKEVKTYTDKQVKNNFYLTIVNHVLDHHSLPALGSKQFRNYYLRPLKVSGILEKKGYGTWGINLDKWEKNKYKYTDQTSKNMGRYGNIIRGHGYHFKIKLPHIIDWSKREFILKKSNIPYDLLKNGAYRIKIFDNKLWLVDDGIVFRVKEAQSFYSKDAENAELESLYYVKRILKRLGLRLGYDLSHQGKYMIQVDKAHYAKVEDELARKANHDKEKIRCVLNGEEWLLVDKSLAEDELEAVGKKSKIDMDKIVVPFMNSLKEHYDRTGESPSFLNVIEAISGLVKHDQMYAENQASHLKYIKILGENVGRLVDETKKVKVAAWSMGQTKIGDFE